MCLYVFVWVFKHSREWRYDDAILVSITWNIVQYRIGIWHHQIEIFTFLIKLHFMQKSLFVCFLIIAKVHEKFVKITFIPHNIACFRKHNRFKFIFSLVQLSPSCSYWIRCFTMNNVSKIFMSLNWFRVNHTYSRYKIINIRWHKMFAYFNENFVSIMSVC